MGAPSGTVVARRYGNWMVENRQPAESRINGIANVMETGGDRTWTAHIVIASSHAGLAPYFRRLEEELLRVLARIDDPRDVRDYLAALRATSAAWLAMLQARHAGK